MDTEKETDRRVSPELVSRLEAISRNTHHVIWCEVCGMQLQHHVSRGNCTMGSFDGLYGDCSCVSMYERGTDGFTLRGMKVALRDIERDMKQLVADAEPRSAELQQYHNSLVGVRQALTAVENALALVVARNKKRQGR